MSTATLEIPKDTWLQFFNEVSQEYQDWDASVEEFDREIGDQHSAEGVPFQGISYDPAGSQAGDILVETGDQGFPYDTHLVHRPRAVRTTTTQLGAEADIEIESEGGMTTLIRLRRRPNLPPGT